MTATSSVASSASSSRRASCPTRSRSGRRSTSTPRSTPNPRDGEQLLTDLGLADSRKAKFGKLSGGQKQRLSVALALIGNPKIAILDELTTGLDPQARRDTWQLIEDVRDSGVTVILVTHFMEEAERLADRIAVIDEGRLVALDTPAGIVSRVDAEQRLRFRPSAPIDDGLLTGLPEVRTVSRHGQTVEVAGTGNLVQAVTAAPRPQPDRGQRAAHRAGRSRGRLRRPHRPQARLVAAASQGEFRC